MTGKRLYNQVLSYDYGDFCASAWNTTNNHATKKWSKKVRRYIERQTKEEIDEVELNGYGEEHIIMI